MSEVVTKESNVKGADVVSKIVEEHGPGVGMTVSIMMRAVELVSELLGAKIKDRGVTVEENFLVINHGVTSMEHNATGEIEKRPVTIKFEVTTGDTAKSVYEVALADYHGRN